MTLHIRTASVAMVVAIAGSAAMAEEGDIATAASPAASQPSLAQGLAKLISKVQALPLPLMPAPSTVAAVAAVETPRAKPVAAAPAEPPPAPAPAPAPARFEAPPPPSQQWILDVADGSIKRALTRWAKAGGWQLVWELPVDFAVEANASFNGQFEDAVTGVAVSMERSEMPLKAIFYRGNKVLRIVAKGAQ